MPELPEVEIVRMGLSRLVVGKTIVSETHDTAKGFPNAPADVEQFLIGAKIIDVRRRAKVLMIDLSTHYTLVIHLKMTGQLVFVHANQERFGAGHPNGSLIGSLPDKSTRVTLAFNDGSHLYFNDQRKFGWVRLTPTLEIENLDFFKKVGPEPLSAETTAAMFLARIKKRRGTSIKAALLDQTTIAGVGNIYAAETLFAAGVSPFRICSKITQKQYQKIWKELVRILNRAVFMGGSTIENYRNGFVWQLMRGCRYIADGLRRAGFTGGWL